MNGVMDRVEVLRLGHLRKLELARGRTVLGFHAHFKVLLGGVGHDFAEQLRELRSMLCLFVSGLFPIEADLRITFAVRNARHRKIHADFGALAGEVGAEAFDDRRVNALGYADNMLGSPIQLFLLNGDELGSRSLALRAGSGRFRTFMYITTNRAAEFHFC